MSVPQVYCASCPGYVAGCAACQKAKRNYATRRDFAISRGQWQPWADPEPVRQHLRELAAAGFGWRQAAIAAGLSPACTQKLMKGTRSGPVTKVRPETAARLLAVRPGTDLLADAALACPVGTRRRLQALVACGWSQNQLAARLGMLPGNFRHTLFTARKVTAATHRAVAALYDELWNQPPPERDRGSRIAAARSRRYAAERGWPPPLAWDDEVIDLVDGAPAPGWRRPQRTPAADRAADARELLREYPKHAVAERLRLSASGLDRLLLRHPEPGEDGQRTETAA